MAYLPLQLPPGIVRGANPDDASGRWYDGSLIRWREGVMEPVGGWSKITTSAFASTPRKIHQWRRNNSPDVMTLIGTDGQLYASSNNTWTDVVPSSFVALTDAGAGGGYGTGTYGSSTYGTPRSGSTTITPTRPAWSIANWGEDALAVASTDGRLMYFDSSSPTTDCTVVSGAPTGNRAVIVTPERHAVLLQAGGEVRRVGWSSREDYTDWNYASTTNTAGFLDLQSETPLIAAESVREGTLIWSVNRVFLMRYVGLPFIYGADDLGTSRLFAPNSFAEFDGRCVWMDASGFMLYEGGAMHPLACPLSDFIFSNIDPIYGPRVSHAAVNGKFDEIWFFYPSEGASECDRYVVWNWSENWWSMGTLARTAAFPAGVSQYPVMCGTDKHLYQHEDGWTYDGFDCANNVFVASGTINIPGDEQSMHITQLVPSNGGQYGLTKYTLFTRMTPNGSERQFGPYYSRSDGYVDTRATGRDVRIRICANAAGDWSIGRLRMKVAAGGRR